MLREGLLVSVRSAIARARKQKTRIRVEGLRVRSSSGWRDVDVEVLPLKTPDPANRAAFIVVFEEPEANVTARARRLHEEALDANESGRRSNKKEANKEDARLKQELAATRDYLRSVIEQQEAANEELQSANEEVQSTNEELQSINEELETSKEEIQSANEELATVNDELQNRNFELSQSNNDLTNLLASVELAIVMLGPDLRIRRFTPAAEKLFNLIPTDIGRALTDIKLNIETDELEMLLADMVKNTSSHEREVRDRNGRWYSMRLRPYRTEQRVEGVVIVMVDIHEQKSAVQALLESEARFELLADTAPVLIWTSDREGCRFVNRAFEEFVGENEPQIRGASISAFMHREEREAFEHVFADAMRERRGFETRARLRRADGVFRWTKMIANPRFAPDGSIAGYVGGAFDITDMKEAEAALLELDRGKNEFLAMLAHELRNPLAGVRNASRLLSESKDPSVIERANQIIDRQTGHMVRLIDDLLEISRITQGKIRMRFDRVDLNAVLQHSVDATDADRKSHGQTITVSRPPTPIVADADPLRVEQVVVNLLQNASKFTPPNGHIWLTLDVDTEGESSMAVIRVRDDGVGIDPATLPYIFDLFLQADHASAQPRRHRARAHARETSRRNARRAHRSGQRRARSRQRVHRPLATSQLVARWRRRKRVYGESKERSTLAIEARSHRGRQRRQHRVPSNLSKRRGSQRRCRLRR